MKNRIAMFAFCLTLPAAYAGQVQIVRADFVKHGDKWNVAVTLKHEDSGWDHYADAWRVVDERGDVVALRNLLHPHEDEQPFTRDLDGVFIAPRQNLLFVEAHDKVHGWSPQRLRVDLRQKEGPGFTISTSR